MPTERVDEDRAGGPTDRAGEPADQGDAGTLEIVGGNGFEGLGLVAPRIVFRDRGDVAVALFGGEFERDDAVGIGIRERLKQDGVDIMLNAKVTHVDQAGGNIRLETGSPEGSTIFAGSELLVATGRVPNSDTLNLAAARVRTDERGFIQVNKQLQTDDPAIYAIGDVVGEPMLAHKASHEGRTAVEAIAGHKVAFEPHAIPAVVFTDPEVAW